MTGTRSFVLIAFLDAEIFTTAVSELFPWSR